MSRALRRVASYSLAIIGVLPALYALKLLQAFQLAPAALFGVAAAAFWVAAFRVDKAGTKQQ